jgi:hypothetical protein
MHAGCKKEDLKECTKPSLTPTAFRAQSQKEMKNKADYINVVLAPTRSHHGRAGRELP